MRRVSPWVLSIFLLGLLAVIWAQNPSNSEALLAQYRNLGKAFYENPTTQAEAVAEFKKALDLAPQSNREKLNYGLALLRAGKMAEAIAQLQEVQKRDPSLPHTWFNLGIYYKKAGDETKAIEQFEQMAKLTPNEPIVHYQLGTLYKLAGRAADAQARFEKAVELDPRLAAARFQLYNIYRQAGRQQDAAAALETFQRLKKEAEGAAIPEDVDWCNYAEIYDPPAPATPERTAANPRFDDRVLPGAVDPKTAGMAAIDSTGTGKVDLLVWSSKGVHLFREGTQPVADSGLAGVVPVFIAPGDFDNDGFMDLAIVTESGPQLYRNNKGKFEKHAATLPQRRFERAVWIDYDHDYDLDLVLPGDSPALARNEGAAGFGDRTASFPFQKGRITGARKLRVDPDSKAFDLAVFYSDRAAVLYRDQLGGNYKVEAYTGPASEPAFPPVDFDNDGRPDRARISDDGAIRLGLNRTPSSNRWIKVQLQGVKSLKAGQDAVVEVRAGLIYRTEAYAGVPLVFDTGSAATVDTVRITWPNGLIQNEIRQATNKAYVYKEAQRLSGSCPMIWTWNGREVEFITDVLGVAPLGASDGEGSYFPVDHDEFVTIPAASLQPVNGEYDIRVTEELSEVSYLDQILLYAVDHPAGTEIFTNEKFKGPPYPEERLYGVERRIYPKSARDDAGNDVLSRLVARDKRYPDQFERTELGVARPHTLELDFAQAAPSGRAVLLLNGWVDWPDGSTFRAAAQESKTGLVMPYLQMQDAAGRWVTVNEDTGMPAGKPKTIAVELRFPSASRKLRIVTSLCVYWDDIFLSESTSAPQVAQRLVPMLGANLQFRGFSEARIHPQRKQPDTFLYGNVSPVSFWNPTPGMYTRFGPVDGLLAEIDDRLVLMGSGDELKLRFNARSLPPVPMGWTRDFLLKVDGWAKDRDPNTAFSSTVEPLPFHGMSRYPYRAGESFPSDPEHEKYRKEYNKRPALQLLRTLKGRS